MEHQPPQPEDQNHNGPEPERLHGGEIDLTGAISQDDALRDVIGDAIAEADADKDSELPDWGARTMARALANRLDDPLSGALHHFAVTGRADKAGIARELIGLYEAVPDDEHRAWIERLGRYVISLPDAEDSPAPRRASEVPLDGSPLDKVLAYFEIAFAEADADGRAITEDDARAIATVLADLLSAQSELAGFAYTGDADPVALYVECQQLKQRRWRPAEVGRWIERFEQHLASRTDLGRQASASQSPSTPQAAQGVQEHGDAFRAYLALAGVDAQQPDVVKRFQDVYIGSFPSIDRLVHELTDIQAAMAAIRAAAEGWGLADYVFVDHRKLFAMACESWDIVHHQGTFHVFMKQ